MELVTAVLGDHGQRPLRDYGTMSSNFRSFDVYSFCFRLACALEMMHIHPIESLRAVIM